jgi:hypothetical protein
VVNENWFELVKVAVIVVFVVGFAKHCIGAFWTMVHALAGDQLTN